MNASAPAAARPLAPRSLAAYALLGAPLMMMALPVYVLVPKLYADATGLALATIGAVLLATRLLDALADPFLGAWVDAERARGELLRPILVAAVPLAGGFVLLFAPVVERGDAGGAAAWLAATLMAAYLGYSLASIAYHAWGAQLARDDHGRARVTAAREGAGLAGVIVAAVVPTVLGVGALSAMFVALLAAGLFLLVRVAPRPRAAAAGRVAPRARSVLAPLASPRLRWLLAVLVVNGIAAAIPATLVLFFIDDALRLSPYSGAFLATYFACGVASMFLWARLARSFDLHAVWLAGMLTAVAAFVWAYALGEGDWAGYAAICVLSGFALGADLAIPPALLARVIDEDGERDRSDGRYFGLWHFFNKLNLAVAAGLALPLLQMLGYSPGARDDGALAALSASYALLPSALKLAAAGLLLAAWRGRKF
ncbi:MAG TPA: MFS transporter [Burkholderiaceae bacterium]